MLGNPLNMRQIAWFRILYIFGVRDSLITSRKKFNKSQIICCVLVPDQNSKKCSIYSWNWHQTLEVLNSVWFYDFSLYESKYFYANTRFPLSRDNCLFFSSLFNSFVYKRYILWCLVTMHPYYKSKFAKETDYCQELTQFQFQCEKFDTCYHSTKNKKLRKKQIDEIKKIIKKIDTKFETTYTTKMRDAFIHHVINYMRFELKILGQKLTQFDADTAMKNVLLLRQKFYRQNMSMLNLMQVQKLDDVDLTLPVPAETEKNLSWLLQETLKCQPRHEGHALQWLRDKISWFCSFNIFAVRASLVVSIKFFTSLGLFVQEKNLRSRR